jgi:hypothetical protein
VKEERVCTTTAQSQKREKDIASKFTIHEKKNPPHPKRKRKNPKPKETQNKITCLRKWWVRTKLEYKITDTIHYNTFALKTVLPITSSELIYNNIIIMHLRIIRGQTSVCCYLLLEVMPYVFLPTPTI